MKNKLFVLSASGFSADIIEYIEDNNKDLENKIEVVGIFGVNTNEYQKYNFRYPFLGHEKDYNFHDHSNVIIPIGNSAIRKKLYSVMKEKK